MAEQIASLGLAIDSSSARTAAEDLRRLADAAGTSEQAMLAIARAQADVEAVNRRGHNENVRQRQALDAQRTANQRAAEAIRARGAAEREATGAAAQATAQLEQTNRTVDHLGVRTESSARSYGAMVAAIMRGDLQQANASLATLASRMAIIPALTTPIGAAVAGVAGSFILLGATAIRSMRQLDEYNRSIIATGSYAATSAQDIREMAREMSTFGEHRIGDIERALAATVASGRVSADALMTVSAAVDNLLTVSSMSAEEALGIFQKLADKPSEALQELNKEYHFLTLELYNNVKALEDNGQAMEAARIAQGAFASELRQRAEDVRESGSIIARAADVAKTAWQEALATVSGWTDRIFGDLTEQEQIVKLSREMATLREKIDSPYVGAAYKQRYQAQLEELDAQREALILRREARQEREEAERQERQNQSAAAAAAATLDSMAARYDRDIRYRQERNELDKAYRTLLSTGAYDELARRGVTYHVETDSFSGGEYDKQRAAIDAAAESRNRLTSAEREAQRVTREQQATYERLSRQAAAYASELELTADSGDKLSKVERFIKVTRDQLAAGTVNLTAVQKQKIEADLTELEVAERRRQETVAHNQALEREAELRARLAESLETATAAAAREIASISMSRRERELSADLDRIANDALRERRRLIKEWGDEATEANAKYMEQLRLIDQYERDRIDLAYRTSAARADAESDWRNGAVRAMKDVRDENMNYAKMAETVVTDSYGAMTNAIMTFSRTGKFEIKDMTVAILESMMQMAAQIAASQILMSILGAFMPAPTGATGTTAIGYQSYGSARGNVFQAGRVVEQFARGGVFTSPTYFPMAGGRTGVMGEAGGVGEAVMPLGRDSSGRLGVRVVDGATGGSGGMVVNAITNVTIDSATGAATTSVTTGSEQSEGRALGVMLTERVKEILVEQSRPGGLLWRMQNGS